MWIAVAPLPMVPQSTGADVLLLTASARVDPLVGVRMFVQLEVGRIAELLQANVTPMFFCMRQVVLFQAGRVDETLGTHFAFVASFSRVNSQMTCEVGVVIETFAANLARERPFPRVDHQMLLETVKLSEPLLANFTFERPFPRVGPHMTIELG